MKDLAPLERDEAHEALSLLLQQRGVRCPHDDLIVQKVTSPAGYPFYVIIALNASARPVAESISPITPPSASPGVYGVWVLRPHELYRLLKNGSQVRTVDRRVLQDRRLNKRENRGTRERRS